MAKLLARLYLPEAGTICWDGVDVASVDPDSVRRHVAVIFQDFLRYHLPARENIGLGRWEAIDSLAEIEEAARQAGADSFLRGLGSSTRRGWGPSSTGAAEVSIGQWQRIALARAFFRDAPFVILDEPTAALDARAEHELFACIRTFLAGRTVLLISHRFSSVRSADRIYVLHEGRIAVAPAAPQDPHPPRRQPPQRSVVALTPLVTRLPESGCCPGRLFDRVERPPHRRFP
ncbi:MAG TPA: ABC transporter ATP-binding protein [Acidimicrobiales bacterium]|nr:ABC transporter ATP-binding protein [Acidimicrobiales bacterium]